MAKKTTPKNKDKKPTKKGKKSVFGKIMKGILITLLCLFGLSIITTIVYRWVNPPITLTMISRHMFEDEPIKKEWKDIDDISPYLVQAAVASEDNFFIAHHGFDRVAIDMARERNKELGYNKFGASTISQQTAKNVFLWQKRSWIRKGLEVYFTALIEVFWSKERIMEVYLNVIEMGHGIYGAEAASQEYFHKSANKLTKHQAALIVATLPNPRKFNAGKPSKYVNNRSASIESLMGKIGQIKFDDESIEKAQERFDKHVDKYFERKEKKENKSND